MVQPVSAISARHRSKSSPVEVCRLAARVARAATCRAWYLVSPRASTAAVISAARLRSSPGGRAHRSRSGYPHITADQERVHQTLCPAQRGGRSAVMSTVLARAW